MASQTIQNSARTGRKKNLFASAVWIALMAASASPTWAANYTAADQTELQNVLAAANAHSDASSTITLTNNITPFQFSHSVPTNQTHQFYRARKQ